MHVGDWYVYMMNCVIVWWHVCLPFVLDLYGFCYGCVGGRWVEDNVDDDEQR